MGKGLSLKELEGGKGMFHYITFHHESCGRTNFPVKNWFAPDNFTQRRASISQLDSYAIEAPYSWELKAFLSHFQVPFTDNTVGNSMDV